MQEMTIYKQNNIMEYELMIELAAEWQSFFVQVLLHTNKDPLILDLFHTHETHQCCRIISCSICLFPFTASFFKYGSHFPSQAFISIIITNVLYIIKKMFFRPQKDNHC